MPNTKRIVSFAIPVALMVSACSSDTSSSQPPTTLAVAPTINLTATTTIPPVTTLAPETTTTVPAGVTSSTAKEWEVVVGIYTASAAAQAQIDKLTAAKFVGFTIKPVDGKYAVVLAGFTNAEANALVTKINTSGVGQSRIFHLVGSTATNFEVVDGIYSTSAGAQSQIDKLTKANFLGFTIKPIPGEFAVVLFGLTKAQASAMVTAIDAAGLGPSRVKELP
jgi:hypothetical protein